METSKQKYTYATATRTLLADLYTPVAVYMRLRDLYPQKRPHILPVCLRHPLQRRLKR